MDVSTITLRSQRRPRIGSARCFWVHSSSIIGHRVGHMRRFRWPIIIIVGGGGVRMFLLFWHRFRPRMGTARSLRWIIIVRRIVGRIAAVTIFGRVGTAHGLGQAMRWMGRRMVACHVQLPRVFAVIEIVLRNANPRIRTIERAEDDRDGECAQ